MAQPADVDLLQRLEQARRAIDTAPDRADLLVTYGALLHATGALGEAHRVLERAVSRWPGDPEARHQLGRLYAGVGNHEAALPHYEALVALVPDSVPALTLLGQVLAAEGRSAHAITVLERAIARAPDDAAALASYGIVLTDVGRFDDAVAAYGRAIEAAPQSAFGYLALAKLRPSAVGAEQRSALEQLAGGTAATERDRWESHFALAALDDAAGDYANAARHLLIANATRRSTIRYDERATLGALERISETYDRTFFGAETGASDGEHTGAIDDELPVFVFGLPRSGTTLVEQILASHPRVFGAGELPRFAMHANEVLGADGAFVPQVVRGAGADRLREVGRRYVADLRRRAPAAERIVDKMTMNYRFAGLIQRVLPRARMIEVRRDPRETALSCFMQTFDGELAWPYDLREIAAYFRAYERVMAHWRAVLPAHAILEVHYEDLVDDLAGQARRIVAFCGLAWDDACLRFYETSRTVRTASASQVRRPIYRSSLGRAQHYQDLLRPFVEAFARD